MKNNFNQLLYLHYHAWQTLKISNEINLQLQNLWIELMKTSKNHKFQNISSWHKIFSKSVNRIFLQHMWPKKKLNHQCNYYYDGPVSRSITHISSLLLFAWPSFSQAIMLDFTTTGRHHKKNFFLTKWKLHFQL